LKFLFALALTLVIALSAVYLNAAVPPGSPVPDAACVRIECPGNHSGSGFAFHNGTDEFVWTAGHVVKSCETIRKVVDPLTGKSRWEVSYDDCKVVQSIQEGGRKVGETFRFAEILRFSDIDEGMDIALLKTRSRLTSVGVKISRERAVVGDRIQHIGSPSGRSFEYSFLSGAVSGVNRPRHGLKHAEGKPVPSYYDQYDLAIAGGCSGGPAFCPKTGEVVGLVTAQHSENPSIAFSIPAWAIRKFAREHGCLFAVDASEKVTGLRLTNPRVTPFQEPAEAPTLPPGLTIPLPLPGGPAK
jgi:S1-C subfamily serine protease